MSCRIVEQDGKAQVIVVRRRPPGCEQGIRLHDKRVGDEVKIRFRGFQGAESVQPARDGAGGTGADLDRTHTGALLDVALAEITG